MPNSRKLRVFGVTGAAFSGTTLLNFMLGAHRHVFATGEAHQLFRCYRDVTGECRSVGMCSVHHESCDFWTERVLAQCEQHDVTALHKHIAAFSKMTSVVVHSFKFEVYAELLRERAPLDGLIVLFKRPVAYYCSRKAHEGGTVEKAAAKYISRYREIRDLSKDQQLPVTTVFYEDLATKPQDVLRTLCAWMGLSYEPVMTVPWEAVNRLHTIGGNAGTYLHLWDESMRERMLNSAYWREVHGERGRVWLLDNFRRIRLDERWKSLPPEEIREMEACLPAREIFENLMMQRLSPESGTCKTAVLEGTR